MTVPAFDLSRAYRRIAPPLEARWSRILDTTSFVLGPAVREFEAAFASYLGAAGCVGVANGTDALLLALRALGVRPGDEVIVPAFTFFATAEAVILAGAQPVFADVQPETLNLDPADAAARVTARTVGILGVHLYGRPFDVDAVEALCARHGLWLVEDAAQAQGATWNARPAGALAPLAAWSFYPSKNLGCFGDGGAVTGRDAALLERVRLLANHGQTGRYQYAAVGTNSRLDALQAAVLLCRLELLDQDNDRRREHACKYHGALTGLGDLRLLQDPPAARSVYHQLTVLTPRRAELMEHLKSHGIGFAIHYPEPLHRLAALAPHLPPQPELPVAERAAREVLSLPMFPELTDGERDEVCGAVREFYGA